MWVNKLAVHDKQQEKGFHPFLPVLPLSYIILAHLKKAKPPCNDMFLCVVECQSHCCVTDRDGQRQMSIFLSGLDPFYSFLPPVIVVILLFRFICDHMVFQLNIIQAFYILPLLRFQLEGEKKFYYIKTVSHCD